MACNSNMLDSHLGNISSIFNHINQNNLLDWQTHNNAIFGTKFFLDIFPIVLISAINHLAI